MRVNLKEAVHHVFDKNLRHLPKKCTSQNVFDKGIYKMNLIKCTIIKYS